VLVHHVDPRGARPIRIRLAQKIGDLFGVAPPFGVRLSTRASRLALRFAPRKNDLAA
jgi:hypothetical protein